MFFFPSFSDGGVDGPHGGSRWYSSSSSIQREDLYVWCDIRLFSHAGKPILCLCLWSTCTKVDMLFKEITFMQLLVFMEVHLCLLCGWMKDENTKAAIKRVCVSFPQDEVYRSTTKDLIEGLISGYNATVFAYGPTGQYTHHSYQGLANI